MRSLHAWTPVLAAATLLVGGTAPALAQSTGTTGPISPYIQVTVTSNNLSEALAPQPPLEFGPNPSGLPIISVDPSTQYQTIKGFGAAMTDSAAWLIHDQLPAATQNTLMRNLFTSSGIHIGFLRVPMAASDFTVHGQPYNYDESPTPDPTLRHFSIAHDLPYVVPELQQALTLNPHTFTIATEWSPPAWMKGNDALDNRLGAGTVLSRDLPALGRYFVKFLQAYRRLGIDISAVTPQNEPTVHTGYPGANLPAGEEAQFITHDLSPALTAARLPTKIYGYDFGWSIASTPYASALLHTQAASHIAGLAWHCYFGEPNVMSEFHVEMPQLDQIVSECSPGIIPFSASELIIGATRNWASAVALWNLALNPHGGPVQPPDSGCRNCTGLVTVDQQTHTVSYTREYYQLGQFSKFVEPGAVRVGSDNFTSYSYPGRGLDFAQPGVDDVAFDNPDGSLVLIAYNNSRNASGFDLDFGGRYASYSLSPEETATFVWNLPESAFPAPYQLRPPVSTFPAAGLTSRLAR